MAVDANGRWIGLGVGDSDDPNTPRSAPNWDAITLLTGKLNAKYQWARDLGVVQQPNYDTTVAAAVAEFCQRSGLPTLKDNTGNAVANLTMRTRLGSYPPPAPPTHALFTVRGTGGVIGQDYTSQIAQALPGVYHEHPIDYLATMGGIPVGVAGAGPSGDECADQAEHLLKEAVEGSTVSFAIAGYSLGTKGVVQFLNRLFDTNDPLNAHAHRLVCVVLMADPWRPFGHTFFLGPIPSGRGIGAPFFTMSDAAIAAMGWRCCWLAAPGDLYTNSPLGATGQVLADGERIVLETAVSDPLNTIKTVIPYLLRMVGKDGGLPVLGGTASGGTGPLGGLLGSTGVALLQGVASNPTTLTLGLATLLLPLLEGSFTGLVDGITGNGADLSAGVAADVQAAILALKFFGSDVWPHIHYHDQPWSPNSPQTYLQLAIQHANDWGTRTAVVT